MNVLIATSVDASPPVAGMAGRSRGCILLLDRQMPSWDAARIERRVINATPEELYDATLRTDFVDAVRHDRLVQILFALRAAGERIATALRMQRPRLRSVPTLRVDALPLRGEWVTLGHDWPNEIAFGAIGRFWAGETKWLVTDASVFAKFRAAGFAKIGCHITFRPLGNCRTLVTYEARTKATDEASRRAFLRYWRIVSPFVGIVMRAMLATIERNLERA